MCPKALRAGSLIADPWNPWCTNSSEACVPAWATWAATRSRSCRRRRNSCASPMPACARVTCTTSSSPARRLTTMSSKRRDVRFWVSAWIPVLLGILMIVVESTEWLGADYTSSPLRLLYQAIFGQVTNAEWEMIHHYIRKSGHFIGYGLIGLAWLRAWWMSLPRSQFFPDALLALVGTALI